MLYVLHKNNFDEQLFVMFDTNTDSTFSCSYDKLIRLLNKTNMTLKNATISEGKLITNKWPREMTDLTFTLGARRYNNILLSRMGNLFKVTDSTGEIRYLNEKELKEEIIREKIDNCDWVVEKGEQIFRSTDTYNIEQDNEFRESVDKQYKDFIVKTRLLGLDLSMEYIVEGKEVKIIRYTGKSKKVILPSFATSITYGVFLDMKLEEVRLNNGLKYIGTSAFRFNNIKSIIIPKTVKYAGHGAFTGNKPLYIFNNMKPVKFNDATFKTESEKTIIFDNLFKEIGV